VLLLAVEIQIAVETQNINPRCATPDFSCFPLLPDKDRLRADGDLLFAEWPHRKSLPHIRSYCQCPVATEQPDI